MEFNSLWEIVKSPPAVIVSGICLLLLYNKIKAHDKDNQYHRELIDKKDNEAKEDRRKYMESVDKMTSKFDSVVHKIDKTDAKLDKLDAKIDKQESKIDSILRERGDK